MKIEKSHQQDQYFLLEGKPLNWKKGKVWTKIVGVLK